MTRTRTFVRVSNLLALAFAVLVLALVVGCGGSSSSSNNGGAPGTPGAGGGGTGGGGGGTGGGGGGTGGGGGGTGGSVPLQTTVVAKGLTIPWAIAFAPDGRIFFTEQPGRLRVIVNGQLLPTPVIDVTNVSPGGEAGMLGLALDPNFASNHFLYVFYCIGPKATPNCNIGRFIESNNTATFDNAMLSFPEAAPDHTGGRLKIGPDNNLYLTTGDWDNPALAQDMNSFAGKILRMTLDGGVPPDNPFPTNSIPFIYTLGHRDPQGIAWDSSGQLYEDEHGPVSNDEVNIISAGKNYGWPTCVGICNNPAFVDPVKLFTPPITRPPSGSTFYNGTLIPQWNGSMLIAMLGLANNPNAHQIHRILFDHPGGTNIVQEEDMYVNQFGRIRDVVEAPDGSVYFSTSNGNGSDVIVQVRPQ